ncbi:hypothetical protein RNZ50_00045 [Paracoccaceae bacterium Fryx2]|nr:hypothetical protein [Paracoccaceae bacterium Fryx2]
MITFHTPEVPPSLNLDLRELDGGGSCPAQFHGATHDGRSVHVRYRGRCLRVDIAKASGDDAIHGTNGLDVLIGTPLDGTMILGRLFADLDQIREVAREGFDV